MHDDGLFRPDAVSHKAAAAGGPTGDVLRLSPRWVDRTYQAVLLMGTVALLLSLWVQLGEYATGPAVVQLTGRIPVSATQPGIVVEVLATPGNAVRAGDPLVSLYDHLELAAVQRATERYDVALATFLEDPQATAARVEVARLRAEVQGAQAAAAGRVLRAPTSGVLAEIYAVEGRTLAAGDPVAAIGDPAGHPNVVAILPGRMRPMLRVGDALQLELHGFDRVPRVAEIVAVGGEVVGPAQARHTLGAERSDALEWSGPAVVVRARLLDPTLHTENGVVVPYVHGMPAEASVRVRSQAVAAALVPGLDRWLPGGR